ncbi:protein NPG1-like [Hordeum vulgare subsp. vulgare]|uniref:Calmodulin-binding protein MPCBP n=1 Tax=Hordeum vulgare subsp. vulgare TaxID=112509 RepID=A0A8I6YXV0_HORVV|nr:protein NPG1-like [Hordeum vulgare subsp. vulgare]
MAEPEDGGEVAPPEAAAATNAAADSSPPVKEEPAPAAEAKPASSGEGVSLNYEEARALLGRLEFQKGNVEAALCVFDGIDLQAAIERFQPSSSKKTTEATLVLEAIYLKALSLQKLGKSTDAAQQCKSVIDSVESMFKNGTPDIEQKLQETINKSVELLPEAWKKAGSLQETFAAYRRALLSPWNLDEECITRIQKRFAVFLLYGCVEGSPPSSGSPAEGTFAPKTNIEEAILLLTILLKKWYQGKTHWDPSVMEHLTYALSICSQPSLIANHLEEVLPGIYPRTERWNTLAFCYYAVGQKEVALNFLRKSLNKHENPKDTMALLLAAKICSEDRRLASEGVEYARRATANTESLDVHLKSTGLHFLGSCLSKKAKTVSSDHQRAMLQTETMKSLTEAMSLDRNNPNLIFDMGVEYAEQRNMNAALRCAREFIDATGASVSKGWRFLALVLSAQQRYSEAEVATNAALDETAKWDQGSLLRIKAKLKVAQSSPMEAVEAYRVLLALVQAQKNSPKKVEGEADAVTEFEIWQGLANLYSSLSHCRDAEVCLQKARALKLYSAATLEAEGYMHEVRKESKEALAAYVNASAMELEYVSSKVAIGALLSKQGGKYLPAARAFLSDALRVEPTNRMAWLNLGKVHKLDGRIADAADCFQAAVMLEESDPVESFRTL